MGRLLLLVLTAMLMTIGCGHEGTGEGAATITAVSSSQIVVGETVEFFGHNLIEEGSDADSITRLRFRGTFETTHGENVPVDLVVTPSINREQGVDGRDVLTWRRFGPFANPFTGDERIGTYRGQVMIMRQGDDGMVTTGEGMDMELTVEPSIVIEMFQPLDAECNAPALRALSGLPYQLQVKVGGLQPTRFTYEISQVNSNEGITRIVHDFGTGNPVASDVLGQDEAIIFNQVPSDTQFYVSGVRIIAEDDQGRTAETAMPMTIHRPIEVRYGGQYELAEVYEPEPVSGCIPGSLGGQAEYRETRTETRQQSVNVTVSTDWRRSQSNTVSDSLKEGISIGESQSSARGGSEWEGETARDSYGVTYGRNEANDLNYSSRDGESWSWNVNEGESNEEFESRLNSIYGEGSWSGTVGASGEGSIPGFAKVSGSASTTVGVTAGAKTAGTEGNRRRTSRDVGYGMGGSRDETRSYGSTTGESRSESLGGSYSLSGNRQSRFNNTEERDMGRTWNMAQGSSDSQTISEGQSEAESRTWVTSESLATSQSYRGRIPRSKVGIFYRQTSRWIRRAEVRTYDMCGLALHAGELQFNEWTWAAELAIGNECTTEPPPSELPSAQCYISPCGG